MTPSQTLSHHSTRATPVSATTFSARRLGVDDEIGDPNGDTIRHDHVPENRNLV